MIARSRDRVISNTSSEINAGIRRRMEANVGYFSEHPDEIPHRLQELDREWDVERALEALSSSLTLSGLLMGAVGARRWLLLSITVQGFFLQHALQGWCPPLPLLRRMGFRTVNELEEERIALRQIFSEHHRESRH